MNHQASQPRPVRSFHLVVKSIGSVCNLGCTYCYYLRKEDRLGLAPGGRMSDEVLDAIIRQAITGQDLDEIVFNWHGGEPALLGLDYFRHVVELQRRYAGPKSIRNNFQTNGTLLDEAWCEFFKRHDFFIGLSLDGPREVHDPFRQDRSGTPSFDAVYRAARLLQKHQVLFNTLTVVNAVVARQPAEVYRFFTEDLGCHRLQWLPCVERKDGHATAPGCWEMDRMPVVGSDAARPGRPESVVTDWSVDPDDWGEFLCETFSLWLRHGLGKVLVNWFETLVGQLMGQRAMMCNLAPVCGRSLVTVEKDGSAYSCDHFVFPEYRLGNLCDPDASLADMVYSDQQRRFGCQKRDGLPDYCKACRYTLLEHVIVQRQCLGRAVQAVHAGHLHHRRTPKRLGDARRGSCVPRQRSNRRLSPFSRTGRPRVFLVG